MYLKKIVLSNFKNIETANLSFSQKMNCICGENGEGKTNLLDAIYYLSMTRSFLSSADQFTYRYGENEAVINGLYQREDDSEVSIAISVKSEGEKLVKKGGKAYQRLSEHIGEIPIIVVAPTDIHLISESGEERRKFMNILLSQTDRRYLVEMQGYNRLLLQRNKLLKSSYSVELLEAITQQMAPKADYIHECRKGLVASIIDKAKNYYYAISDGRQEINIEYVSDLFKGDLFTLLSAAQEKERILKYTSAGIQRDDLNFIMDGYSVKKCASQGQQKSFLIALKLAQFDMIKKSLGIPPILLLDDLFDKLDYRRIANLIEMISDEFGQIFITDTNIQRVGEFVKTGSGNSTFYKVQNGTFQQLEREDIV